MKRYLIFVSFLVLVVMSSGCINSDTTNNQTFNKSGVFFTYPGEWSEMNLTDLKNVSLSPKNAVGGVMNEDQDFIVAVHKYPSGGMSVSALKTQLKSVYASENISNITSKTIDGKKAFIAETTSQGESKKVVAILTSKYIYLIEFWTKTENFAEMQNTINDIVSTIQIS